jgi:periplasmic protein TonB
MSTYANTSDSQPFDRLGRGLTWAIALHIGAAAVIAGWALVNHIHGPHWGESVQQTGAIQASMVSAIPLPPKAAPIDKNVLASDNVTPVPAPQPKEATQPPPKPDDVLIKGKTPDKAAPKPTVAIPVKHPQPVPDTTKAASGDAATQLPQSVSQVKNGTATVTVQDRVFGTRYAYYLRLVGQLVNQNYNPNEADPRSSQGKSVSVLFDIERDGTVSGLHIETRSGSSTLDTAAMRAIQRIETFGPLPAGDHITIEYKFDYHQS